MQTQAFAPTPSSLVLVPALAVPDLRHGVSDLEIASRALSHAVNYLVSEQLAGRRDDLAANRAAIAILCEAGRSLGTIERREPARRAIATWLRGASLARALRFPPDLADFAV